MTLSHNSFNLIGIVRQLKGTLTNTNQLKCVVSKNGFCSKIRNYYINNNKNSLRKTQEISNLENSLDNEEFKLYDFITISGKGKSTIRIGKLTFYK